MLREQVAAIRASAAAQVAMADAILRALDAPVAPTPSGPTSCEHPIEVRIATARMGAPNAWRCECGVEGEG